MIEVLGDSARGCEFALIRLMVDGDRIVDADADGLERQLEGLTFLEAAAVGGETLAVDALAERASFPVAVHCSLSERLPGPIETAAYYVVAESLTNVARYAEATRVTVRLARQDGYALVDVEDDGIGGASPDGGSGIRGLIDRIDALDGSLDVWSEPGRGTRIQAKIPLASVQGG